MPKEKGEKATKKKKDPNQPKKAPSAYQIWSSDNRAAVKKTQKSDVKPTEMMSILAEKWKAVDASVKKEYEKKAVKGKEQYVKDMEEYKKNKPSSEEDSDDDKKKSKKPKKKKDPNAPKKPLSNFMIYSADKRAGVKEKNPDFKVTDIGRRIGEMWKEESDKVKKSYSDKAAVLKSEYAVALEKYKAEKPDSSSEDEKPKKSEKKETKKKVETKKETKKPEPKKKEVKKDDKKDSKKKKVESDSESSSATSSDEETESESD